MFFTGLEDFTKLAKPPSMQDDLFLTLLAEIGANMLIHSSTKSGDSVQNLFLQCLDAFGVEPR